MSHGYAAKALGIFDKIIFTGGKNADRSTRVDYFFDSEEDHANIAWELTSMRRCGEMSNGRRYV